MECLGGNGYVEEGILARHYREAPVNAIWEGSGNVMCLDVLRALGRESDAAMALFEGLMADTKGLPGAKDAVALLAKTFRRPDAERVARQAVETLAQLAAAAALNRISLAHAELFALTRLGDKHGEMYGAAEISAEQSRDLLERALP
jgi:putative acyl-CoA dehydrogenase